MKNHINITRILCIAASAWMTITTISCKKLIEIPPPANQISSQTLFADSISTMGAIAGLYNSYNVAAAVPNMYGSALTIYTGLTGDELVPITTGNASDLGMYGNVILSPDIKNATNWSNVYTSIYRINACLEGVGGSLGISAALKQQLTGELKVNRAMCYFYAVNVFGGVPLVLSSDFTVNQSLPRATSDDVYKQIITDLTDARQLLSPTYPSAGRARPNLYVADALLAKVYLYRGQWSDAENAANAVINSGLYTMVQNLTSVFLDGSNEAIWQLPANGTNKQTAEATIFVPTSATVIPTYSLSSKLLSVFEIGDLRKQQWTGTNTVNGTTYYYPFKYKNRTAAAPIEDYMMIRLGELYLIRAEVLAQENNITAALTDLGKVRSPLRVGLAAYSGPTDQTSVLNAILHERQVELFCEWGNRWLDLKRTGTINAVLSTEKTAWTPTAALFPIPLAQIQSNPFLTQNPGYN